MTLRKPLWAIAGVLLLGTLYAQLPFREYPGVEYRVGDIALPSDYTDKTEWTFARLMYMSRSVSFSDRTPGWLIAAAASAGSKSRPIRRSSSNSSSRTTSTTACACSQPTVFAS